MTSRRKSHGPEEVHALPQASIAAPHSLLILRREGHSLTQFFCRNRCSRLLYHLLVLRNEGRSITRETRPCIPLPRVPAALCTAGLWPALSQLTLQPRQGGTHASKNEPTEFPTACAASPAQHGLRAQARRSTNDASSCPARYRLRWFYSRRLLVRYAVQTA